MNIYFSENYKLDKKSIFRFFNDLHLEFDNNFSIPNLNRNEIIIFAGDVIAQGRNKKMNPKTLEFLLPIIENGNHIVWVNGNHEYYGSKIYKVNQFFQELSDKYENFHFLNNSSVFINDIEFLGGTLWTDINKQNATTRFELESARYNSYPDKNGIQDYKKIAMKRTSPRVHYNKLKTSDTIQFHLETVKYIKSRIGKHKKQVVVTHHAPSDIFVDLERYSNPVTKFNFYSELEWLAKNFNFWICGHTHKKVNKKIGKTHFLSNPRGYLGTDDVDDIVNNFDPYWSIEIGEIL